MKPTVRRRAPGEERPTSSATWPSHPCKTREAPPAQIPRAIPYRSHQALTPILITSSLYGGAGFLAVDTAASGLCRLEVTFEHGTVAAFHFDLVDHAAVTGRSITIAYSLLMSTGKRE